MGFGTEKIEDEIKLFFPEAKVARMDLDTTRSKNSYHKIIGDFVDSFDCAFRNRINHSHRMMHLSDFNLEYTGGLQQVEREQLERALRFEWFP